MERNEKVLTGERIPNKKHMNAPQHHLPKSLSLDIHLYIYRYLCRVNASKDSAAPTLCADLRPVQRARVCLSKVHARQQNTVCSQL